MRKRKPTMHSLKLILSGLSLDTKRERKKKHTSNYEGEKTKERIKGTVIGKGVIVHYKTIRNFPFIS